MQGGTARYDVASRRLGPVESYRMNLSHSTHIEPAEQQAALDTFLPHPLKGRHVRSQRLSTHRQP
jgi:hypothetical protein